LHPGLTDPPGEFSAPEPERERRARIRGAARQVLERRLDRLPVDERVSPLVECDALREQLGAQPVGLAPGGIELSAVPEAVLSADPDRLMQGLRNVST
jgi:hypothetical protein